MEPEFQKPNFAAVQKAESARNDIEREKLKTEQEKALADALKRAEPRNLGEEGKKEIEVAVQKIYQEKQEKLAQQQQERGDRIELLYRGPPSERER